MIIAIDTGGTKTLLTNFNSDGHPGEQIKFPTPQDPQEYIKLIRETLNEKYSGQKIDAIIIAVPGTLDNNNAIIWCPNLPDWAGFDVTNTLRGVLNDVPIYIENDAKLAGLSEAKMLNPTPKQALYVTISTGIGTGIITEGHIDPDLRNSEGGRQLIEFDGKLQEWQDFASGKSFYQTFGKYVSDINDEPTLKEMAHRMSLGFLALIPSLQPNTVIIGGSVGTHYDKYIGYLLDILKQELPAHIPCPQFVQAKNPEQAVIYGCYYYAIDNDVTITN